MKFEWQGEMYEMLNQDKLTWVEMSVIEDKAGITTEELAAPEYRGRALVTAAFAWASIKRQNPTVTWEEFINSPMSAMVFEEEPEEQEAPAPLTGSSDDPLTPTATDDSGSETSGGST